LRDDYKGEPEKFYKRADGFTTMIKHPTLSPTQIEGIQQWCYEQDFQRLGPSIFRVVESWLLGYHKLKDSTNPLLRAKARFYAKEVRKSYPIFLAGRLLGPNPAIRQWIADLAKRSHSAIGRPSLKERALSLIAVGAALWTGFTLKFNLFQHPSVRRTAYRVPGEKQNVMLWESPHTHELKHEPEVGDRVEPQEPVTVEAGPAK
jgi:hypothetical protein